MLLALHHPYHCYHHLTQNKPQKLGELKIKKTMTFECFKYNLLFDRSQSALSELTFRYTRFYMRLLSFRIMLQPKVNHTNSVRL